MTWPRDGVPRNPAGWLLTVGRRRAIDAYRRRSMLDERYAALARDLGEGGGTAGGDDLLWDPDRIDDDVLALMFISCHPVLSREAQVALTLAVAIARQMPGVPVKLMYSRTSSRPPTTL